MNKEENRRKNIMGHLDFEITPAEAFETHATNAIKTSAVGTTEGPHWLRDCQTWGSRRHTKDPQCMSNGHW